MTDTVRCPAPAKINLALHVTGRRSDGFHDLESLVVFCLTGDELSFRFAETAPAGSFGLTCTGPFGEGLSAQANLVATAHHKLAESHGGRFAALPGIACTLEKDLPVASGVGGGSADAAAALIGLRRLCRLDASDADLFALGTELGSDVPMCLHSSPLIARGRGTRIDAVRLPVLHLVLVNPGISLPTPDVFHALTRRENPGLPAVPAGNDTALLADWLNGQRNDLEAPALSLAPAIGDCLAALRHSDAQCVRMSGSGATCFGLHENAAAAQAAADRIASQQPGWWVVATETAAFGLDRAMASGSQ
ncbi:MAG: 4-(cytidine 5'-diphospho)-2-C-methyl-D-erythritol kinase [Nitratireductor sp.]|nr:4-(cytidine 5'-diphospho)-2-C-methyl-D-erythritol kinase [Nitratireductor sp.]